MKVFLILLFILISCGYPDIDSVSDFKKLKITKEESIDLCNLIYTDSRELSKCLDEVNTLNQK